MLDLFPGLDLALYLGAWVLTTVVALALWDWCTPKEDR